MSRKPKIGDWRIVEDPHSGAISIHCFDLSYPGPFSTQWAWRYIMSVGSLEEARQWIAAEIRRPIILDGYDKTGRRIS